MVSLKQYMHSGDLWGYLGGKEQLSLAPRLCHLSAFLDEGVLSPGPAGPQSSQEAHGRVHGKPLWPLGCGPGRMHLLFSDGKDTKADSHLGF